MSFVNCKECGEEYSMKRAKLGYYLCLECGDSRATRIANFRSKCSAPAYNKGAYQPMMTIDDARWAGK
jgi:ribosomal protein L37AE/L43A